MSQEGSLPATLFQPGNRYGEASKYKPAYAHLAYRLCLLRGQFIKDEDLAAFFEVTVRTIHNWKKAHPEFGEAIKEGKEIADQNVAETAYHAALGSVVEEEQAFKVRKVNPATGKMEDHVEVVKVKRHIPPDSRLIDRWLTARGRWQRDPTPQPNVSVNIETVNVAVTKEAVRSQLGDLLHDALAHTARPAEEPSADD